MKFIEFHYFHNYRVELQDFHDCRGFGIEFLDLNGSRDSQLEFNDFRCFHYSRLNLFIDFHYFRDSHILILLFL